MACDSRLGPLCPCFQPLPHREHSSPRGAARRCPPVAFHSVNKATLAGKLRSERGLGMVCASAWLLDCRGGLDAAIAVLRPGGVLAVLGQTDQDAVDIATLVDARTGGGQTSSLEFAACGRGR